MLRFISLVTFILLGQFLMAQPFQPSDLPNLSLWLRADSGLVQSGGVVSQWTDFSPNGISAFPPTPANSPTVVYPPEFNNKPAVSFNGINNVLQSVQMIPQLNTASLTVFIVAKGYSQTGIGAAFLMVNDPYIGLWIQRSMYAGNYRLICNLQMNNTVLDIPNAVPNSGFPYRVFGFQKDSAVSIKLDTNGVQGAFDNTTVGFSTPFTNSIYTIGESNTFLYGEIAEIIVYTRSLTPVQKQQVNNYIFNKYAPKVNLGADIIENHSFCPKTLNAGSWFNSYLWSTGETTPSITVDHSGSYSVTVTDVFRRISSDTINITLPQKLKLNHQNDTIICLGNPYELVPSVSGFNNYNFLWSNGQTSDSIPVVASGNFFVKVTDNFGCSVLSDTLLVVVDSLNRFVALTQDTTLCNGDSLGINVGGGYNPTFHWSTGSSNNAIYPPSSGSYSVTVSDLYCSSSATTVVTKAIGNPPNVNFSGDTVCFHQKFAPQNQTYSVGGMSNYFWSFGDGGSSSDSMPTHNFNAPGTYVVTLKATGSNGCVGAVTKAILVETPPTALFTGANGCTANSYQFLDLSTAPPGESIVNWSWSFGDIGSSNSQSPLHLYSVAGSYLVRLAVTDSKGCSDTLSKNILVGGGSALQSATLTIPANNASLQSNTVLFAWNSGGTATSYSLVLAKNSQFVSPTYYNNINSGQYTVNGLLQNQTYYWKVVAYNSCHDSATSAVNKFTIFNPGNSSCPLALWLRADSGVVTNGSSVTKWKDVSGNSYNATAPAVVDSQPTLVNIPLLNNLPSISFNGTTNELYGVQIPGIDTQSLTVFIVNEGDNQSGIYAEGLLTFGTRDAGMWIYRRTFLEDFTFLNNYQGVGDIVNIPNSMPNSGYPFTIWGMRKQYNTEVTLYKNGNNEKMDGESHATGSFTNAPYLIGNTFFNNIPGFSNLHGKIAEIIVFACALSDSSRQQVESYIYNKYAPPVYLGADIVQPYKLCPNTLNAGNRFSNYLWSTGATTSQIVVNASGTYWVRVTDVFGRVSSDTINVTTPDINLNQPASISVCSGQTVNIATNLSSTANYTFSWDNGLAITPAINAGNEGSYFVKVTDTSGCSRMSDTSMVHIDNFAASVSLGADTTLCSGGIITLANPSSGLGSLTFQWSNGGSDSVVTINTSGPVTVTVTNANGCSGTDTKIVTLTSSQAAAVNFIGDTLCFGQNFTPHNLSSPVDSIASYLWTFGDNSTSPSGSPVHHYASPGLYNVGLSVVTYSGCSTAINKIVKVDALPVASFQGSPACVDNSYQFSDFSSASPGENIINWHWSFGDLSTSDSTDPLHIYSASGNYSVTVTVTNNFGCTAHATRNIFVAGAAAFTPASLTVPENNAVLQSHDVVFGWNSSAGAVSYALQIATDEFFTTPATYNNILINQDSVTGLSSNTTYYWRVIAYNSCHDSTVSITDSFSIFSPSDWSCLTLWLRADSGVVASGGNVSQWKDGSGNNYNATSSSGQPTLINEPLLNHMPALKFNGVDQSLNGAPIPYINSSSLTIFVVNAGDSVSSDPNTSLAAGLFTIGPLSNGMWVYRRMLYGDYTFVNNYGSNNDILHVGNSMPNKGYPYTIWGMRKNFNIESSLYINGEMEADTSDPVISGGFTNDSYVVGQTPYNNLKGKIAEIVIYTCALSDAERHKIESYLYNKYAPPVYLGPDIVQTYRLCPVTLSTGGRFVSYAWSTGDTTAQISVHQSGTYSVSVVDVFGRASTDTIKVTLPYQGSVPAGDTAICFGDSISISQSISHPGSYNYLWNTGATTSQINVNTQGLYYSTISDTSGCSIKTDTVFVKVDSFALTTIVTADTLICSGGSVMLATNGYIVSSYLWSPGGDTIAAPPINSAGLYQVTATDINGCVATGAVNVLTHAATPVADFDVNGQCLGVATSFINLSYATSPDVLDSIFWHFGGGAPDTSSKENPETNYHAFGNYAITLSVKTDSGCTASKTKTIPIYPAPGAGFSYTGSNTSANSAGILCAGTGVQFTDTSIAIGSVPLVSRIWEFNGINNNDTFPTILYNFETQGDYKVTLIEENSRGCVDSLVQQIKVFAPLTANFTYENVCLGDSTVFKDITPSYSVIAWKWSFGDNFTSTIQNPTHTYTSANSYTVALVVQNAIGCISSVSKSVDIVKNPIADITSLTGCENHYYTPLDNSTVFGDPIEHWRWNINGNIYNNHSPQIFLPDTNSFSVKLTVTTHDGCTDSVIKQVHVEQSPTVAFTYTPQYGSAPIEIDFTNNSTNATSYEWNFGDGNFSSQASPQHTYTENDSFIVVLYAQNSLGCTDSLSKQLMIVATDLDISVDAIYTYQTTQTDGSMLVRVVAQVSNQGTRLINSAAFTAVLGSGNTMWQNWTGTLQSGQAMIDTFPTEFLLTSGSANTFVCIEAKEVNGGQAEINYNNNRACSSLTNTMQLAGPYPSPAIYESVLGIILPKAGPVVIDIFGENGKPVISQVKSNLPEGRTDFNIPVLQLSSAEYYIRVTYGNDTQIRKFIVR